MRLRRFPTSPLRVLTRATPSPPPRVPRYGRVKNEQEREEKERSGGRATVRIVSDFPGRSSYTTRYIHFKWHRKLTSFSTSTDCFLFLENSVSAWLWILLANAFIHFKKYVALISHSIIIRNEERKSEKDTYRERKRGKRENWRFVIINDGARKIIWNGINKVFGSGETSWGCMKSWQSRVSRSRVPGETLPRCDPVGTI